MCTTVTLSRRGRSSSSVSRFRFSVSLVSSTTRRDRAIANVGNRSLLGIESVPQLADQLMQYFPVDRLGDVPAEAAGSGAVSYCFGQLFGHRHAHLPYFAAVQLGALPNEHLGGQHRDDALHT